VRASAVYLYVTAQCRCPDPARVGRQRICAGPSSCRGRRRRWAPLAHWKGERILYQQDERTGAPSAVIAERLGVMTPAPKSAAAAPRRKQKQPAGGGKVLHPLRRLLTQSPGWWW
jgi:hypothetical protein